MIVAMLTPTKPDEPTAPPFAPPPPSFATRRVLVIATVTAAVHVVAAARPGWWYDEATTVALGRLHLTWGYVDQPPLGPALAALTGVIAPDSMLVMRLPTVLATALAVVLTALIARELGGDRRAQTLAALAQATTPWGAFTGHWLVPYGLEPAAWLVLAWSLVRWIRTRDDMLLLVAGVATGIAAELRFQAILLGAVLLVAVAVCGPRELLRRPLLWVGAIVATLIAAPTLIWQARAGWPQLRMGSTAAAEAGPLFGGWPGIAVGFVIVAGVLGAGLLVVALWGSTLWGSTPWGTATRPELRDVRFLGVTFVVLAVFFVVTLGRPYYLAGLYGALAAVGAVTLQRRREAADAEGARSRWRWVAWPAGVLSIAAAAGMLAFSGTVQNDGGAKVATPVASVYRALPPADRARTAVLGGSYIYAAFLDTSGRTMGLPPAYSTNRSYGYLPAPPESQDQVLYVGSSPAELRPYFPTIRQVGDLGDAKIWMASGRVEPWSAIWPRLRHFDVQ